jgi:hypothetical protein
MKKYRMWAADKVAAVRALAFTATLATAATVIAQRPIPSEQWDRESHVTLAKAFVGEGGWEAQRDWDGIAHVLARRWSQAVGRNPSMRFVDMVRAYCAPLRGKRPKKRRQQWIRALTIEGAQPAHWPAHRVDWADRVGSWRAALTRAAEWAQGEVADPCRGRAFHWGSKSDPVPAGHTRIRCGDTLNRFYERERR